MMSEKLRRTSDPTINVLREARSTASPAGMDSSKNGRVCAICSHPVSTGPAPSNKTAASGAAANAYLLGKLRKEIRPTYASERRG